MTPSERPSTFEPRLPALLSLAVFVLVALTIFFPMLGGQFLAGDDQLIAGYAFRHFGAEAFRQTGQIPQWNPYIFGGIPFFAVIGHGDIFYPTAWLRWVVSTDVGMTLGFFAHVVLAGWGMYALLRGLRLSWGAAVVGGVAYELTGMVTGQISPGHDGKLFVAALAPLAFLMLIRAIRHGRLGAFGGFAVIAGLAMLTPQTQMAYYLMVACGLFTLWLCFVDAERPRDRSPWIPLAAAAGAAVLGLGISMIEVLPILTHIKYTPRGTGGPSLGWEYASQFAMPIEELATTIYPQFNGMLDNYWGQNFFKSHTEYLGALAVALAIFGIAPARKRGLLLPFGVIAGLFLLVAFGGHTPFYQLLWYRLPMMSSVRAVGMAFYLVALPVAVMAGLGAESLLAREVRARTVFTTLGVLATLALLGAGGVMQGVAESIANGLARAMPDPQRAQAIVNRVVENEPALRMGGVRLLVVLLLGGGVVVAIHRGMLRGAVAVVALVAVVGADNWSILHNFAKWFPPAAVTYADDPITTAMRKTPMPFRSFDPSGDTQIGQQARMYQASTLMARDVPTLFGYQGMESKYFDELFGTKNIWANQFNGGLWNLYAVEFLVAPIPMDTLVAYAGGAGMAVTPFTGYHLVMGPVALDQNAVLKRQPQAYLYQRDSAARWVRVVPAAVKVPDSLIVPTVIDPRFPLNSFVLYPDTVSVQAVQPGGVAPAPVAVKASLAKWQPGAMTVKLDGSDARTTYLLVAENWYPDWQATVDGKPAKAMRADGALLSVALPPGTREVTFTYDVPEYHTGKMITLLSLLGVLGLLGAGWMQRRTVNG